MKKHVLCLSECQLTLSENKSDSEHFPDLLHCYPSCISHITHTILPVRANTIHVPVNTYCMVYKNGCVYLISNRIKGPQPSIKHCCNSKYEVSSEQFSLSKFS